MLGCLLAIAELARSCRHSCEMTFILYACTHELPAVVNSSLCLLPAISMAQVECEREELTMSDADISIMWKALICTGQYTCLSAMVPSQESYINCNPHSCAHSASSPICVSS